MKKILLSILLGFGVIHVFSSTPIEAVTKSFLVTDTLNVPTPDNVFGRLYFHKTITFTYKKGKVVLSGKPDGTGNFSIGDMLRVDFTNPNVGTITYTGNANLCTVFNDTLPPQDISHKFFSHPSATQPSLGFRFQHWCYRPKTIGPLYVVYFEEEAATPSPTPPPSPTPAPFLDLPWEYERQGLSFTSAALAMTAYFDHGYPLLSTSLTEPTNFSTRLIPYDNPDQSDLEYSSHDGYDYAKTAKAFYGSSVLAAADGVATFHNECTACGNAIYIDHGNFYQTRYYHLQKDGLITSVPNHPVTVVRGQPIGKIGATGNVFPASEEGAHIHFMVVQDKNKDGNFSDNIPDGITDPYGWQSPVPDPWPLYSFNYDGQDRQGNTSHYLWLKPISTKQINTIGGSTLQAEKFTVSLPDTISEDPLTWKIQLSPHVQLSSSVRSLGATADITATNLLGQLIDSFEQFFTIEINFNAVDLSVYNPQTMTIYSTADGLHWRPELTTIDWLEKKASARVNHLTRFALMAERIDTTAPVTTAVLDGTQGEPGWYRSDVQVSLQAEDNENGLGIDYTLQVNGTEGWDWSEYTTPLSYKKEGAHTLRFYSVDLDDNIESQQSHSFYIDKTIPELVIKLNPDTNKFDTLSSDPVSRQSIGTKNTVFTAQDKAGNTARLTANTIYEQNTSHLDLLTLQYNDHEPVDVSNYRLKVQSITSGNNQAANKIVQTLSINNDIKLILEYDASLDKTTIIRKEKNGEKTSLVVNNLKILQIYTQNGTINYKYN